MASRVARVLRFMVPVIGVLGVLHVYLLSRLIWRAGLPPAVVALASVVFGLLLLSIPGGFILRFSGRAPGVRRWLQPLSLAWLGTIGVLLTITIATDLARWLIGWWVTLPADVGRWQAIAIAALGVPSIAYARWSASGVPRVRRVSVPLRGLGAGLSGLRIVQLSDVHIGDTLGAHYLDKVVARVNQLEPDVVAITGDLVDGSVAALRDEVAPLARLRARHGVFFVTGNHEYYSGVEDWIDELRRLGLTVLLNEHRVLSGGGSQLALGGVTDYSGGQFRADHESRPDLAFRGAPEAAPRVLLAHQPRSARAAAAAGVQLQLSGHTHGGQIFPFHLMVRLQQPVLGGLDRLHGITVYTHRGTGFWGPAMRFGAPAEIAELTLVDLPE